MSAAKASSILARWRPPRPRSPCPAGALPLAALAAIVAGIAAGAVWGFIPGALKVRLEVNEVVSTLMLNFIALLTTEYLVTKPLRDQTAYGAVSFVIPAGRLDS